MAHAATRPPRLLNNFPKWTLSQTFQNSHIRPKYLKTAKSYIINLTIDFGVVKKLAQDACKRYFFERTKNHCFSTLYDV